MYHASVPSGRWYALLVREDTRETVWIDADGDPDFVKLRREVTRGPLRRSWENARADAHALIDGIRAHDQRALEAEFRL